MIRYIYSGLFRLLLALWVCVTPISLWAVTEINVETAGTLSSLLTSTERQLKVTGFINGSDIKFLREKINAGAVTSLDLEGVRIVSGGEAYTESFTTQNDIIGEQMFYKCSKLTAMVLPSTVTSIKKNAFANTGIKKIDIPNSVLSVEEDAFAYCNSLATVVVGKKVKSLSKGVFYGSNVTKAYVKPMSPPSVGPYLFSSKPTVYVYKDALNDYKASGWNEFYSSISGTLERYYPQEPDEDDTAKELCAVFFDDAACTQLKAEYQAMSDEELTQAMTDVGTPDYLMEIIIKVKNQTWAAYEQEFRIHSYKAYSDANYWNDKLWVRCASYMGNPTGIYVQNDGDPLYVFVDEDVPSDATLYFAGLGVDKMFNNAKTGQKLLKGLNIIDGEAGKLYYVLYTADTKSMTKRLEEWPEMKIHIEGGVVDGYYDASRHTDTDYRKLLRKVTYETFVVKGLHSVMNIRTSILKETYSTKIHKAIACLDSLSVWEKDLSGMTEAVANGEKAGAPYYLSGGDAFYPGYFNNPTYVDNDSPGSVAHATEYGIHISFDATKTFLNPYASSSYDENGTAHELGHQLQFPIMLCGFTEGTNDLFSNYCRFHVGHRITSGNPLTTTMQEFVSRESFYWRNVNNSCLRMFFSLYLYYHQAQKNTSFYPELFKALRADRIESQGKYIDSNKSGLKFVRKVCEVAQEDLTDFFTVYGFFEPATNRYLECYGDHYVTIRQADIDNTKATIAQYPVKNREIIFIEDRVKGLPTTSFVTTAGQQRIGQKDGFYGDVGQFSDYLPGACEPSEYVYYQSDSLYALVGNGGLGFLMLDEEGNILYAANSKNFCIPASYLSSLTTHLFSLDADGSLHEVPKAGSGTEFVTLTKAGTLKSELKNSQVIKLIVSGPINTTDLSYMKQLVSKGNLQAIDLQQAQASSIPNNQFQNTSKLAAMCLPPTVTSIGSNAFSSSGLRMIEIPDKVTSLGEDAFAYCSGLNTVILGSGLKSLSKGAFYDSRVKDVYVKALTPPSVSSYLFSSNPTIHVYASALSRYQSSAWAEFGTIVGDLTDEIIDGLTPDLSLRRGEEMVNGKWSNGNCYDLFGRKVYEMKPGSIYIRNGKKIIM